MRQIRLALAITMGCTICLSSAAPASAAISGHVLEAKAGQFCKVAELGKKKVAANGVLIKCTKEGNRARWKNAN